MTQRFKTTHQTTLICLYMIFGLTGCGFLSGALQNLSKPSCTLSSTWATVDDYLYPSGSGAGVTGFGAIGMGGDATLYVAGIGLDAGGVSHWIVRKSIDGGAHWSIADDYQMASTTDSGARSVVVHPDGAVYVIGNATDGAGNAFWLVRRSRNGGTTWEIADKYQHNAVDSTAQGIAVDSRNRIFVVGYGNDVFYHWIIRRSDTGDLGTWNVVEDFLYNQDSFGFNILALPGGVLYAYGSGRDGAGVERWLVRRSVNGGDLGTWALVDDYQPNAGFASTAKNVFVNSAGIFNSLGSVTDAGNNTHWVLRQSTTGNNGTWVVKDDYQSTAGQSSSAVAMTQSFSGVHYVVGQGGDGVTNSCEVRKSPDAAAGSWMQSDSFKIAGGATCVPFTIARDPAGNLFYAGYADDSASTLHWMVRKLTCQ